MLTWGWNVGWVLIFIAGTVFFLTRHVENGDWSPWNPLWLGFWQSKIWIEIAAGTIVVVWFTWGGIRDVKRLLRDLADRPIDESDDGFIQDAGPDAARGREPN